MRKYFRFHFDAWALLLFAMVMIPNVIWFAVPAPNDVLRNDSVTTVADNIASVCQVLFIAAMCLLQNEKAHKIRWSPLIVATLACLIVYYIGWVLYYHGHADPLVILLLTIPPCFAFLLYIIDRKNWIALVPAAIFAICHLIFGVVNYIC